MEKQLSEDDLEIYLKLQKLEMEMEGLKEELRQNTKATQELLVAWQNSKFTVTMAKKLGAIGLFSLTVIAAWHKAKEGL